MKYANMIIEVDPHIHTVISGHSWSTLNDYAEQAIRTGMKGFCLTEHGFRTPGGPPEFIPQAELQIPEVYKGIRVFKGLEANILDYDGSLDVREKYLKFLEFCIASIHFFCLRGGTEEQNTEAYRNVLKNPYVDMIGHPDDPEVPCDLEALVLETKNWNKIIELNNRSLSPNRIDRADNAQKMMKLCKKHGVRICISSDAHWHEMMGDYAASLNFLEEIDFPKELIANLTLERFLQYVEERKARFRP